MNRSMTILLASLAPLIGQPASGQPTGNTQPERQSLDGRGIWSHFAGNAAHNAIPTTTPVLLDSPAWMNNEFATIPQSGLVVDEQRVYAVVSDPASATNTAAVAYDRFDGSVLWNEPISAPLLDSWSTPTLDPAHHALLSASGSTLACIDTRTGQTRWSTELGGIVVNASPVCSDDLSPQSRVFITNYSFGGGSSASLTCINTDPFSSTINPYQPGEIVWQAPLNGDSSGNSPAYCDTRVFVATASDATSNHGKIMAFDATATNAPSPLWTFTNPINAGFYGGVSVQRGSVYASSYSFFGLQNSANTVRVDAQNGSLVWSVPTNRTDATPIVLADGSVIVSGGLAPPGTDFLPFFGSLPSVQRIEETQSTAMLIWDSAIDTHEDLNSNGFWDFGEPFLSIGAWTHQPLPVTVGNETYLLVATLPASSPGTTIEHSSDLWLIDLQQSPDAPGFILEHAAGLGDSPAFASGWIYTAGTIGVAGFPPSTRAQRIKSVLDRLQTNTISPKHARELIIE